LSTKKYILRKQIFFSLFLQFVYLKLSLQVLSALSSLKDLCRFSNTGTPVFRPPVPDHQPQKTKIILKYKKLSAVNLFLPLIVLHDVRKIFFEEERKMKETNKNMNRVSDNKYTSEKNSNENKRERSQKSQKNQKNQSSDKNQRSSR